MSWDRWYYLFESRKDWTQLYAGRAIFNWKPSRGPKPWAEFDPGAVVVHSPNATRGALHRLDRLEWLYRQRKDWARKPYNWRFIVQDRTGISEKWL